MGRVIGWFLILVGIIAIGVVVYLFTSGTVPGGFLPVLMFSAPGLLAVVIGATLVRAANRRKGDTYTPDPEWTRRRLRER